jgi:hypothetical protein
MSSRSPENSIERHRILQSQVVNSEHAIYVAEASYSDKENYYPETLSPFLSLSLFQAAIIQYRLWKQNGDPAYKDRFDVAVSRIGSFGDRWLIVG